MGKLLKEIVRPLASYLHEKLPDTTLSDKFLLPYLSFWAGLVLKIHKPYIIGISGTAGKTTLTQLLGHVLMQEAACPYVGSVGKTIDNRNGDYGLRFSILRKSKFARTRLQRLRLLKAIPLLAIKQLREKNYPKTLVLEYGTYAGGHIHDLVKFAAPQVGIITNIGPAHLERHKTVEGVYLEKRPIVQAPPPNGLVILGDGHDYVSRLKEDARAPVKVVEGRGLELARNITKEVCTFLKIPEEIVETGLQSFQTPPGRLNRIGKAGILFIDDTYNANPLSMKLALESLAEEKSQGGKKIAVLGFMAELDAYTGFYHKEIGKFAKEKADLLIGVGEGSQDYEADYWFRTPELCAGDVKRMLRPGDVVLFKGSHSSNVGRVLKEVLTHFPL